MIDTEVAADTAREEIEANLQHYKATGDIEAKNAVILYYSRLVKQITRRMMPKYSSYNDYDDLVNCGIIGLIDAIDKFDLRQGVKFETYAVSRIRGEILDYMRAQDWAPSSLRRKISAITGTYEQIEGELGRPPTDEMVAERLEMPILQMRKIMAQTYTFNLINFEDMLSVTQAVAMVSCAESERPEARLLNTEMHSVLTATIDELPEKERLVITLYYYEELMIKEIAEILGVSESRISQIHSKVLGKMRVKLQKLIG